MGDPRPEAVLWVRGLWQRFARLRRGQRAPAAKSRGPLSEEERAAGLDQRPALERGAAEQHAESHLVAIGERKLDRPGFIAELEQRGDDVALLDAASRVPHRALVDGPRLAGDLEGIALLHRLQDEAEPKRATAADGLDAIGMQRAGARAGVDLRLDGVDAEIGQRDPFAPPDGERLLGDASFHARG